MRSVGMIEMNGIKKLNFIEVHTRKKNDFLLINKYDIILFQLLFLFFLKRQKQRKPQLS